MVFAAGTMRCNSATDKGKVKASGAARAQMPSPEALCLRSVPTSQKGSTSSAHDCIAVIIITVTMY